MRCLVLEGDAGLIRKLLDRLSALPGPTFGILEEREGQPVVRFPNTLPEGIPGAMPPDVLLVPAGSVPAAPVLLCGSRSPGGPLVLARFAEAGDAAEEDLPLLTPDSPDQLFLDLLDGVFPVLPQRTAEECGRCGLDCRRLAERILSGLSSVADCRVLSGAAGVRVVSGGREIPLGEFPAQIVENTMRGLLSALRGYVGEAGTTVHLGPEENRRPD